MRYLLVLLLFWGTCGFLQAQDCSCSDHLEWLIKTFSENDAGFAFAMEQKTEAEYQLHNQTFRKRASEVEDVYACGPLLYEWMTFFRSGHMGIELIADEPSQDDDAVKLSEKEIREKYKNTEVIELTEKELVEKFADLETPSMEGIWKSGNYTIAVIRDEDNKEREYVGFIVEADGVYWMPGQVKIEWPSYTQENLLETKFYMRDHSIRDFETSLIGNNLMKVGYMFWERVSPKYETLPAEDRYYRSMVAEAPFAEAVDDDAVLIRIPSFSFGYKPQIDSVLAANHDLIASRPILIIDIRDNGGGSDSSYEQLIKYLYTNPIRTVGLEFLSTPLNNSRMAMFAEDPDWDEESREWARQALEKLNQHLGEFVNVMGEKVSIDTLEEVLPLPKKVGILINENNGSTAEQFLLAAKQSQKVKLFGVSTAGVLDISNQNVVPFPCEIYQLYYALSKTYRIPDFPIDDIGIQPDFFMNRFIPKEAWIDTALEALRAY